MKAFTKTVYGGPEVLRLEEIALPTLKESQVLVKVFANSANPADWHILRGKPLFARLSFGLFKPKDKVLGADFSGIVEAIGSKVTQFRVGDKVFGETLKGGAFAEYVAIDADCCALMPEGVGFLEMACVPIAGLTALQALTTHGRLQKGESVLVNGASGGVGHFTVQIAKAYGAIVTAVCSSKNAEFVQSLGADYVVAYDETDIHLHPTQYDLVIDTHGNLTFADFKRMGRRNVLIGFTTIGNMAAVLLRKAVSKLNLIQFTAKASTKDLATLAALLQEQAIRVHVERSYSYLHLPQAIAYIEAMRTRGKVGMVWRNADGSPYTG